MLGFLVMERLGMEPGELLVASDRFLLVMRQAPGLALAVALHQVLDDADDLLLGEPRIEQRRPLAFRELALAGAAAHEPDVAALPRPSHEGEVSRGSFTRIRAGGIHAAEVRDVGWHAPSPSISPQPQ